MKKNIDRILIMFGFLAMLIMIFFMCARGGKTEPFIRTYDLIQDAIIEPMKNFTDSIQDGTGNINADTITANKIVSETLNEYIKKTDSVYADSILTTQSKVIYVDKNRTDNYTADGTILKPYKTIQEAINIIAALETSNYCAIEISTGNYTENLIFEDSRIQRISLLGKGKVYINPVAGYAIKSETENDSLYSLNLDNIIISKPILITAANNNSEAFTDMLWNNISFTGVSNLSINSVNSLTLRNCYSEQSNSFSFSNICWLLLANSNFQGNLSIENTVTKNIPSCGIYNAQFHSYSTYQAGTVNYTADTLQEVVLNGCRWGWQNTTIPDSITVYAHNSYLRGDITNQGTVYLRNSQCQSIAGGNIIYQNFDYQIDNSSNKSGATVKDALDICLSKTDYISGDSVVMDAESLFNLTEAWQSRFGAGRLYGGQIYDNGNGTVRIDSGCGIVKMVDGEIEQLPNSYDSAAISKNNYVCWDSVAALALVDTAYNYIYYEGASGTIKTTTNFYSISFYRDFTIGRAYREGNNIVVRLCGTNLWNFDRRVQLFGEEVFPIVRGTGLITSEVDTRFINITAGVLWAELVNRFSIPAFNSSLASDSFTYWYRDGLGGFIAIKDSSQIDNLRWDNNGTLTSLTSNRYGVHWVYVVHDGSVHIVYGRGDYKLALANAATPPSSIPGILNSYGTLIAKITIQQGATNIASISNPFTTVFNSSLVQNHNDFGGLNQGEYIHLTAAEKAKFDALYFTVLNDTDLFSDTSIINDTTLITDTGAFVIYGDSLGINLNNYSYSYEILFDTGTLAGTWGQTNLLVYRVKTGNGRIIFKSDIYNFPANTIEVSLFRRRN